MGWNEEEFRCECYRKAYAEALLRKATLILRYLDSPAYLRKLLFPFHKDLKFVGLLPPLDAPHHVRATDKVKYREGVTVRKDGVNETFVNVGLPKV